MGGPASPDSSWKGSLNVSYNIGPGFIGNSSARSVLILFCSYNFAKKEKNPSEEKALNQYIYRYSGDIYFLLLRINLEIIIRI